MTDNLFDDTSDIPSVDPNKNYLPDLVGEGKKFKTQEDLARGKYESDQYIEILKKRLDEMRTDYLQLKQDTTTRANLEELINQMKSQAPSDNTPKVQSQPSFDPKQIESLVSSKIQEHETTRRQDENFNLVRDRLQQRYGSNYKNAVKEQIEELGITETELNEMARRQPKFLMKTLGLDKEVQKDPFQAPPRSEQIGSFRPSGAKERTWSYYQELKKTDPKLYYDRKIAVQMQQDAIALGDKFYDGNFYVKGLHEQA